MTPAPLIVSGPAGEIPLPAYPLPGRARDRHPLFVMEATVYLRTRHGWERIPRGYVTDFASIPNIATILTGLDLQALGPWAWAAIAHDWRYAVGQPGLRPIADDIFHERLALDGVDAFRREILYRAVRWGGQGGYDKAPAWWATENFADPATGAYFNPKTGRNPVAPPFAREEAFDGRTWGLRPQPDWNEALAA